MIEGGTGGSRTVTGLEFEKRVDILKAISDLPGYSVDDDRNIFFKGEKVAISLRGHSLYRYLKENGINYKDYLSKRWIPDEAMLVYSTNTIHIIEMKFQKVGGSVDEKLQTCDFKKKHYGKLFAPLDINVEYLYILSEWFKKPSYEDTLNYILDSGCKYYIEKLPLQAINLPVADKE